MTEALKHTRRWFHFRLGKLLIPRRCSTGIIASVLCLAVAIAGTAVVTVRFAPQFGFWRGLSVADDMPIALAEFSRACPTLAQVNDPFAPVANKHHIVIAWRLLFPFVWYTLKLPSWLFLAMPHVGCVLTLWLMAWLTYKRSQTWWTTVFATALFGALPWFFVSVGWLAYFDSWLVLGLLTIAFVRPRWIVALSCLLTPWIDERILLALPASTLVRFATARYVENQRWQAMGWDIGTVLVASLPYLVARAVAWLHGDPDSSAYIQSHWQLAHTVAWPQYLLGIWSGYRVGWLFIGAAVVLWARRVGWGWGGALAIVVFGDAVGGLFIAWDMSRTLMILTPVFVLGIWLWEEWRPTVCAGLLPTVLTANMLLPAAHVTWLMNARISTLPKEIDRWNHPPPIFGAVEFVRRARSAQEAGKIADALAYFDDAIAADSSYAQAYVQRGLLRIKQGDLAGAERDADEALRANADYPYALVLRGLLREANGQLALAVDDLRQALARAPPDWWFRDETQRSLAQLQAQLQEGDQRSDAQPR
jgi:hypothetical protein